MDELPRPARLYVGGVIAIGLTLMVLRLPDATFAQPVLFLALLILSSMTAALKVHLPLTTSGSTMSVSYAVDFASLLLLGPHETMLVAAGSAFSQCRPEQQGTQSDSPHAVLGRVAGHHRAGIRLRLPPARRRRVLAGVHRAGAPAGRRGHRLLPAEYRADRDRDRAVDRHPDHQHLAQQLPVERAELLRRRRHRGAGRRVRHQRRLLGRPVHLRAALSDLPYLQGLHGAHRRRAAPRAADLRPAPGHDRSAGARDRRQGSDDADAHPAGAGVRDRARQQAASCRTRKSRASRPRRCCTTSASWPCPSTSSRSRDR